MPKRKLHEVNRLSWNAATKAHNSHKSDQAAFFRTGGSTLRPEEIALLGDIRGQVLVHLQCNAGQDTLSIVSKLGATATGVDISDEAINFARKLSADSGIPATFVRADVYDWLEETVHSEMRYDVVFSSYGALCWLSDLKTWAKGIHNILKPGGRFVLVEFHQAAMMFEEGWHLTYDYMGGEAVRFEDGVGDYVALTGSVSEGAYQDGVDTFRNPNPVYEFAWGIADTVTTFLEAGMSLSALREYTYCNGFKPFADMRELPGRRFTMPDGMPVIPFMFGLVAQKPEG